MPPLAGFAVLTLCAIIVIGVIRRATVSSGELEEEARGDDLLPRLIPYAYHGDRARLVAEFGSVPGLLALRRACRAKAALIERREGSGVIRAQARSYSKASRGLIRRAIAETVARRVFPARPPIYLSIYLCAAVQVYCELAVTYEALVNVV